MATLPNPNPIPNIARFFYQYQVSSTQTISTSLNTNTVFTQINLANLSQTKTSTPNYVKIGDAITYTISITNNGNVSANNVVFIDTIPNDTIFVPNSLFINNVANTGNPNTGVTINTIPANSTTTITFKVTVISLPTTNPLQNQSLADYNFFVDPNSTPLSTSGISNTSTTQVNQAIIDNSTGSGLNKSVDKTYATLGDTLTYTIIVKNTGNVTANNIVFTDTISPILSLVPNSVTLNGITQPGATVIPPIGLSIGSLVPNSLSTITFKVLVNSLPSTNPIPNSGTVKYTFTVDPSIPNGASGSGNSNIITTTIFKAIIDNASGGLTKSVNKSYANIGDTLTFTTTITNTGNTSANNVLFIDTIPNGTTLIPNSVFVNGVQQIGANPSPPNGVSIGSIPANNTVTVSFAVLVVSIPNPNPIQNSANIQFKFTTDPSLPNGNSGSGNSNTTSSQINNVNFNPINSGISKLVDNIYANIYDTLTYTIVLKNLGNVPANNVILFDTIPLYTNLISNSVTINNIIQSGADPNTGISIGSINPAEFVTVTFKVIVTSLPTSNPIQNSAIVNYSYTVNPSIPNGEASSNQSPIVSTTVSAAIIGNLNGTSSGFTKIVSPSYATIGSILTYTIALSNTGNTSANNIILVDTTPYGTTFISNSVIINNISVPGSNPNPPNGILIPTLSPNATTTLSFKVIVNTIPSPNPIANTANLKYQYTSNPNYPNGSNSSSNTNQAITQINAAIIDNTNGLLKTSNPSFVKVNDTITYTIRLNNTGNTPANNVIFTDTIPPGTSFVPNSVSINNSPQIGSNPQSGINIGTIAPNIPVTITFQVTVTTIPTPNPIENSGTVMYNYTIDPSLPNMAIGSGNSNINKTQVNQAIIDNPNGGGFIKVSTKSYATVGDTITYTISLKNTGNTTANNITLIDTLPSSTLLEPNSITINGVPQPGTTIEPPTGLYIGSITPGAITTVIFTVKVTTLPDPSLNPITNSASIKFNFTVDPSVPNGSTSEGNSNITTSQINTATFKDGTGKLVKFVDKQNVTIGDKLQYTIYFINGGNVSATNTIFRDTIPTGTTFIPNSFALNNSILPGANPAPPNGVSLGIIPPNSPNTITFSVTVVSLPNPNEIKNSASLSYNYTINPSNPNGGSNTDISNIVQSNLNIADFSTLTNGLTKLQSKSIIELGDTLTYSIRLVNSGNTPANNVTIYDTIPSASIYIPWSTNINGVSSNMNPQSGISIGTINPNEIVTVSFSVLINSLPNPNTVSNSCDLVFSYVVDPISGTSVTIRKPSNTVKASVIYAKLLSTKLVNKLYADLGDTITYTIVYNNVGNVSANSVILTDSLPSCCYFINNSLTLNNTLIPGANPTTGFNIGNLTPNSISTIQFQVVVVSIPTTNPISNTANSTFNYITDPSLPLKVGSSTATSESTQINTASFNTSLGGFTKLSDKTKVSIGTTITYSLVLTNIGTATAQNILLTDSIPNGTSLIPGSLTINGVPSLGNISTGIALVAIPPKATTTITFAVLVTSIVPNFTIQNQALVNYSYIVSPSSPLITKNDLSNISTIPQGVAEVSLTKISNKSTVYYGDTLNYTIIVKNSGNTPANNIFIIDTMPASIRYIDESMLINNIPQPLMNINTGITIPTLAPNNITTISFTAMAVSIPPAGRATNIAYANYSYTADPSLPTITTSTISNPDSIIISYSISPNKKIPITQGCNTIPNNFNLDRLLNIDYSTQSSSNCLFKGTYSISGLCTPEDFACSSSLISKYNMWQEQSINSTFTLDYPIDSIDNVSAKITILRNVTIPTPNTGNYSNLEGKMLTGYKNILEGFIKFTVTFINPDGEFCKKDFYDLFSSYIVIPTKYANCDLAVSSCIEDLLITRFCPNEISLSTTMILYLAPTNTTCESLNCICPMDTSILSSISNSTLCPNIRNFLNSSDYAWNEFNVFFTENSNHSDIGSLNSITADISNISYKLISTPKPIEDSNEGLHLSGNMLLVSFLINARINYTSTDGTNSIHRLNLTIPASSYIVVMNNILCSSIYSVNICIEDIYACNLDSKNIFTNTTLLIKASPCTPTTCC